MYTFLLHYETRGVAENVPNLNFLFSSLLESSFSLAVGTVLAHFTSKSLMVLSKHSSFAGPCSLNVRRTSVCQWLIFKQSFSPLIFYFCSFLWLFSVRPMLMFEAEPWWVFGGGQWEPTADPYPGGRWIWTPGKLPILDSVLHWSDFKPHAASMNLGAHSCLGQTSGLMYNILEQQRLTFCIPSSCWQQAQHTFDLFSILIKVGSGCRSWATKTTMQTNIRTLH